MTLAWVKISQTAPLPSIAMYLLGTKSITKKGTSKDLCCDSEVA